jgi:hypothetical protein
MVDWYGTPHTEALHVVERYRLLDAEAAKDGFSRNAKEHNVAQGMRNANHRGKYLQLQFTVEDQYCPVNLKGVGQKANSGAAFRVTRHVSDLNGK